MSKIRVHELAQKMGIENKELIGRLKELGVEISNHMAAIDDDVVKKLQSPATVTMTVKDVSQEETRVTSTVIRRRAKVVEKQVEVTAEEAAVSAPVEKPPVVSAEKAPEVPAKPAAPVSAEIAEEPAVAQKIAVVQKPTANRAVILGRVELPPPKPERPSERPAERSAERPADRPAQRREVIPSSGRPAPGGRPLSDRPG